LGIAASTELRNGRRGGPHQKKYQKGELRIERWVSCTNWSTRAMSTGKKEGKKNDR